MGDAAAALPDNVPAEPRHLRDLLHQVPVFAVAGVLLAACIWIMARHGIVFHPEMMAANADFYFKSLMLLLIVDSAIALFAIRPDSPLAFVRKRYAGREAASVMLARLPLFLLLVVFMPVFSQTKSMIPLFNDYTWDAAFIAWDRAIFGMDAWRFFQPVLGFPEVTFLLSLLYQVWMLLIFPGTLFLLIYKSSDQIRHRYFLTFMLIWTVIGFGMAAAFASVGPCFLQPIMGDATFAPQMAYLHAADAEYPVFALQVQDLLLEWYNNQEYGLAKGISAMPSMHVAMAFLYFLAIRHVSRKAGWFFFGFFVLIWLASVHIGYHYFVDGLVSVIATAALWWASRLLLQWWEQICGRRHTESTPQIA